MAVVKRWVNWASAASGAVLLAFCLAHTAVTLYMNLTAATNKTNKLNISGAILVSLGVLVFPTCWVSFAAAISRHRGVYITFVVMSSLSILDSIGMLAYQTYVFSTTSGYADDEKGIAITMCVLQALLILVLIFCLSFGAAGLCSECPEHSNRSNKYKYPASPYHMQPPPMYNQAFDGYKMSLPRGAWDYSTEPRHYYKGKY